MEVNAIFVNFFLLVFVRFINIPQSCNRLRLCHGKEIGHPRCPQDGVYDIRNCNEDPCELHGNGSVIMIVFPRMVPLKHFQSVNHLYIDT